MQSVLTRLFGAVLIGGIVLAAAGAVSTRLDASMVFEDLPLIGGIGGSAFSRECPDDHVLTGLRYRRGMLVDGIGIQCRPIRADGTLGSQVNSGSMAGGNGGTYGTASCPSGQVVAEESGLSSGVGISKLYFYCYKWVPATKIFDGARDETLVVNGSGNTLTMHKCTSASQPATGIKGRHGAIVDAAGLHCSAP